MTSPVWNRRRFLTAMGLGAGSLSLPSLGWRRGQAFAGSAPPKRLIVLSSNNGVWWPTWRLSTPQDDATGAWSRSLSGLSTDAFSASLQPLHAWRDRMTVFEGLSLATAELDQAGVRHGVGSIHAWTGNWALLGNDYAGVSPSVDQLVAAQVAREDRLPSLELGHGFEVRPVAHGGYNQPLYIEQDPQALYRRLFGLADAPPLEAARAAARGSMLDWVSEEAAALSRQLAPADQAKLDQHQALVRQLESRLQGLAGLTCSQDDPGRTPSDALEAWEHSNDAFFELIATALSCDITRVVSFSLGDPPTSLVGGGAQEIHADWAHQVFNLDFAVERMTLYQAEVSRRISRLLAALDAIPEGDGTLLDHTLIVWGNELADGAHGFEKYGVVTFGGGWAFPQGQLIHYPFGSTPIEGWAANTRIDHMGLPHQHLLVSIAQAMGVQTDHVGLTQVQGQRGDRISLRGGLPKPF